MEGFTSWMHHNQDESSEDTEDDAEDEFSTSFFSMDSNYAHKNRSSWLHKITRRQKSLPPYETAAALTEKDYQVFMAEKANQTRRAAGYYSPKHFRLFDTAGESISLEYNEIPAFLHNSTLYAALCPEDEENISIPLLYYKPDPLITNSLEFSHLLQVMVFWGVDEIPDSVLTYCNNTAIESWSELTQQLPDNGRLHHLLTSYFKSKWSISAAIATGKEFVTHWLTLNSPRSIYGLGATAQVAELGDLELLIEMVKVRGYVWTSKSSIAAAKGGHLHCLQYMVENGCDIHATCSEIAVQNDHLACLQFLSQIDFGWNDACMNAALISTKPTSECLRYALEQDCAVPEDACLRVFSNGASHETILDRLQLLHEHGAAWDEHVCSAAASCNVTLLRYCMEHDCPYNDDILLCAARLHQVESLKYLVEECLLVVSKEVFSEALVYGMVENVKYLIDIGCPCEFVSPKMFLLKLNDRNILQCIQFAAEHGWPPSVDFLQLTITFNTVLRMCRNYARQENWYHIL